MSLITDSLNPWHRKGEKGERWSVTFASDGDRFFIASNPTFDEANLAVFVAKDASAALELAAELYQVAKSLEESVNGRRNERGVGPTS
jgi:hypothetical protein